MKKLLLIAGLLLLSSQFSFALQEKYDNDIDDYDFSTDSEYITDEQLQDAKEIDVIENKTDFRTKVINSGHFSSQTATKTYIPINKIQK